MTAYTYRAHGAPKGQPRPRAFVRGKRAAVYDPGTAEGWKSCVAQAVKELEARMIDQPVGLDLVFDMPRPKIHYTKKGALKPDSPFWFTGKPDFDNLAKAVADAITQIGVWRDDSLVVDSHITKRYANGAPGCTFTITLL